MLANIAEKEIYLMYVIVVFPVNMCRSVRYLEYKAQREKHKSPLYTEKTRAHTHMYIMVDCVSYHTYI